MRNLTAADFYLLPFYLIAIYSLAFFIRNKYYPEGHPWRPYFISGLSAKISGAIAVGLIYQYYYGGGDTFEFFFHSKLINNSLDISAGTWLRLLTHSANERNMDDMYAISEMYWYDDIASYTTAAIGALIGMFCFTKYLVINIILASISFTGLWALFVTYATQYKNLVKPIAFAVLFMPSVIIWGSGLFKDTVCITAIGWLAYSFYTLFEKKKLRFDLFLVIILSSVLLLKIKSYILISFLPVLIAKTILALRSQIENTTKKRLVTLAFLPVIAIIGIIVYKKASDEMASFNIDKIVRTVVIQKDYLLSVSLAQEGSAYDLGEFEPSLKGMLSKAFPAINVTLFRPYIWEAKSIFLIAISVESLILLTLTCVLIFTKNPFNTIKRILKDSNLIFFLTFTLIFAFFAGISSFNFGSLSRYKIPCMPFFALLLILLLYPEKKKAENETGIDEHK